MFVSPLARLALLLAAAGMPETGPCPRDEAAPQCVFDSAPQQVIAQVTWPTSGVTITMPSVDEAQPSGVVWDDESATLDPASGTWSDETTRETGNTMVATYGTNVYAAADIPAGTTRVVLVVQ